MHLKTRPSLFLSLRATLLHRLRRWDEQPALVLYSSLQYKERLKILDTLWASPPLCASSFSSASSSYSGAASKNDSRSHRERANKKRRRAQAQLRTRRDGESRTLVTANRFSLSRQVLDSSGEKKQKKPGHNCHLQLEHSPIVPFGRTKAHGWSSLLKAAAAILWCAWTSSFTLSKV